MNKSHNFFDSYAAKFFENKINRQHIDLTDKPSTKRFKYTITCKKSSKKYFFFNFNKNILKKIKALDIDLAKDEKNNAYGTALGPDWSFNSAMKGKNESRQVTIEYSCEIKRILSKDVYLNEFNKNDDWPVYVELTNNKIYGCDFIVSATGVVPFIEMFTRNNKFEIASDGGLMVNNKMETNIRDIYAVGDACTAAWHLSPHWFQMRLWNQASQMGDYAARSMWAAKTNEPISLDFCFEMFAHITKFFGYRIILLGKYDANGLGVDQYQLLFRFHFFHHQFYAQ